MTAAPVADFHLSSVGDEAADSWAPLNLATLPDKPPMRPTLGGVGLVYPGKRHVFSGPQESAKTLAAYAIGIEVIRQGGPIVIIDFEMGAWDARNRLRELGATPEEMGRIAYLEPHEPADDTRITRLADLQPTLVIVDAAAGAYDLQGLDDNKRGDVEKLARLYIRSFWRKGIATIMLDHVVKNAEGRGKYAIGSERKVGGADVHLGFETVLPIQRGARGVYRIVTHKDRGGFLQRGTLADLELSSDPHTHRISWAFKPAEHPGEEEQFRPTLLMERVSRHLEKHPKDGIPRGRIETDVKGKVTYLRQAIDALVREGYATENDGPHGSRLIQHERPYRKDEDDSGDDPSPPRPASKQAENDYLVPTSSPQNAETGENTPENVLVPARPGSSRDGVIPTSSTSSPPYRGTQVTGDDEDDLKTSSSSLGFGTTPFIHDDPEAKGLIELYVHTDADAPETEDDP